MRNPQGCYSMDYYFYQALKTVAYNYGITYSEYVSRCMLAIVKAEMVNLDIPLSEIFSPDDRERFAERELEANFRRLPNGSPFTVESRDAFIAFKNYIAKDFGATIPEEAKEYQVQKGTPNRIQNTDNIRHTIRQTPLSTERNYTQYVAKLPEVEDVKRFDDVQENFHEQKEEQLASSKGLYDRNVTTLHNSKEQITSIYTEEKVEEEEKTDVVETVSKPLSKKNLFEKF